MNIVSQMNIASKEVRGEYFVTASYHNDEYRKGYELGMKAASLLTWCVGDVIDTVIRYSRKSSVRDLKPIFSGFERMKKGGENCNTDLIDKAVKIIKSSERLGEIGVLGAVMGILEDSNIYDGAKLVNDIMTNNTASDVVTADEMEEYCPSCAESIRAGEIEVSRDDFEEIIRSRESAIKVDKQLRNLRKGLDLALDALKELTDIRNWDVVVDEMDDRDAPKKLKRLYDSLTSLSLDSRRMNAARKGPQEDIAIKTLKMPDPMVGVMGGMTKEEARKYLRSIGYSRSKIRRLESSSRTADKWNSMPKGWTNESRKKFWDSLTSRAPKHKVTQCIKEMEGKVSNPGAFCASLADKVDPGWRSR